jgi:hypothetical protein
MSMIGDHSEALASDEVKLDSDESEETLIPTVPDTNSPNPHTAATVKLNSPPAPESNSPNSHSAPTVILRPPQTRD